MLIINRESVEGLRERLKDPGQAEQCREELRTMLEIKETLLWRTEARSCCNVPWEIGSHLDWEIRLLEGALQALEDGDPEIASAMLEEYASQLEDEPH